MGTLVFEKVTTSSSIWPDVSLDQPILDQNHYRKNTNAIWWHRWVSSVTVYSLIKCEILSFNSWTSMTLSKSLLLFRLRMNDSKPNFALPQVFKCTISILKRKQLPFLYSTLAATRQSWNKQMTVFRSFFAVIGASENARCNLDSGQFYFNLQSSWDSSVWKN